MLFIWWFVWHCHILKEIIIFFAQTYWRHIYDQGNAYHSRNAVWKISIQAYSLVYWVPENRGVCMKQPLISHCGVVGKLLKLNLKLCPLNPNSWICVATNINMDLFTHALTHALIKAFFYLVRNAEPKQMKQNDFSYSLALFSLLFCALFFLVRVLWHTATLNPKIN